MDGKAKRLRNLRHRLAKPALNNGRVQRSAKRAMLVLGTASTSEVLDWTYALKLHRGDRIAHHDYWSAHRALNRIAHRVGRAPTIGRPILWRLRDE